MSDVYLSGPVPIGLAHRGGWLTDQHGHVRTDLENTALAFEHAARMGYRYVETDVRATADGVLVAFHDPVLDRVTDRSGAIAALPYAEVARARVGGSEPIPLLEDLLGSLPELRFNIDVKADSAVEPLRRVLHRTNAWHRVCVGSFNQARLELVRRTFDRPVALSSGPVDVLRLRVASLLPLLLPLARRDVSCVQIPVHYRGFPLVTRDLVAAAHRLGLQVHVWTINEPFLMERLLDAGVDGIISDNVTALRRILVDRGLWPAASTP